MYPVQEERTRLISGGPLSDPKLVELAALPIGLADKCTRFPIRSLVDQLSLAGMSPQVSL